MGTGIDELDELVCSGKTAVADIKTKWRMKLGGAAVMGIGALMIRYASDSGDIKKIGIAGIVVGVLMILGTDGVKWAIGQIWSAGKNAPKTKV